MATDSGYERGNYLRVCDICGHRFHFRDLKPIGELRFACPDDAPGLTAMQISRFNARAKPLVVKPNKWAKDWAHTGIYQLAEAQIFNYVTTQIVDDMAAGTSTGLSESWAAAYLAELVYQGRRPPAWTRKASLVLAQLLTSLSGRQSTSSNTMLYGGILEGATAVTSYTILAGVAFARAYQALGTALYLTFAGRCAQFLRNVQCGDKAASAPIHTYHVGGLADSATAAGISTSYSVTNIIGLWFLKIMADIQGASTQYGNAAANAQYSSPTIASLTTMMSEITAFAETGAKNSAGEYVTGLSTTAPRSIYSAGSGGSAGSWGGPLYVFSEDVCSALHGLYMANGTSTFITTQIDWLRSYASNSANQTASSTPPMTWMAGVTGTYDPTIAFADALTRSAPFTEFTGAVYDLASTGLIAAALSGSDQAAFRTMKDAASTAYRFSFFDVTTRFPGPATRLGLSLQAIFQPGDDNPLLTLAIDSPVAAAARAGMMYRYDPGRYPIRGN